MKRFFVSTIFSLSLALYAGDFLYSTNKVTGEVALKSYSGTNSLVVIPDFVNRIGSFCFLNNQNLKVLYIPNSVRELGMGAFYGTFNLQHVRMSETVTYVGGICFWGCYNLRYIKVPSKAVVGENTFQYCFGLSEWKPWIYIKNNPIVLVYEGELEYSLDLQEWKTISSNGIYTVEPVNKGYYRAKQ